MGVAFVQTQEVIHHTWTQVEHVPGRVRTSLTLSAPSMGPVRGSLHRPGDYHHHLQIDGFALTGPPELEPEWVPRVRTGLEQLRLRAADRPHSRPRPDGVWEASAQRRFDVTGGPTADDHLPSRPEFIPAEAIVHASTGGGGSIHLFGAGPADSSALHHFRVVDGQAEFTGQTVIYTVPEWLRGVAQEVTGRAIGVQAAADAQLSAHMPSDLPGSVNSRSHLA